MEIISRCRWYRWGIRKILGKEKIM